MRYATSVWTLLSSICICSLSCSNLNNWAGVSDDPKWVVNLSRQGTTTQGIWAQEAVAGYCHLKTMQITFKDDGTGYLEGTLTAEVMSKNVFVMESFKVICTDGSTFTLGKWASCPKINTTDSSGVGWRVDFRYNSTSYYFKLGKCDRSDVTEYHDKQSTAGTQK